MYLLVVGCCMNGRTVLLSLPNSFVAVLLLLQDCFLNPVTPAVLPDYAQVVPLEQQMWLSRIGERVRTQLYLTGSLLCSALLLVG